MTAKVLEQACLIPISQTVTLEGNLFVPEGAHGIVLFAHGSGSSRFSPRNTFVARTLQQRNQATLLLDLLTPQEEKQDNYTGQFRFDIKLLGERVAATTEWLTTYAPTSHLKIGYFGASTGAAAALVAAAQHPLLIGAVVSRGGRPDLAGDALSRVKAPTLLIVGSKDTQVITLNQMAYGLLNVEKSLEFVPGATHLFEEAGALEHVAELAGNWFVQHLSP